MFSIRILDSKDFLQPNLQQVLGQLSPVDYFEEADYVYANMPKEKFIWVAIEKDKIIGTISLYIEQKLTHNEGKVGHIEDLVIDKAHRGKDVGKALCQFAINYANQIKCYKVILDCSEENVMFYEKLGFRRHEVAMRLDL